MNAKTLIKTTTGLALVLGLAACGPVAPSAPSSEEPNSSTGDSALVALLPDDIRSSGVINSASVIPYQPHIMFAEDGTTPEGIVVELNNAVAEKLGLKFNIINSGFDGIFTGVQSGRYDMAIGGFESTPERAEQMVIVQYQKSGAGMLVQGGNPKNIHEFKDACGMTLAGLKGSTFGPLVKRLSDENCIANGLEPVKRDDYPSGAAYFQALESGRADLVLTADLAAKYNADLSNGAMEVVEGVFYDFGEYAAFFAKDDSQLAVAWAAAVDALIDDGTFGDIMNKWGGTGMEKTVILGAEE